MHENVLNQFYHKWMWRQRKINFHSAYIHFNFRHYDTHIHDPSSLSTSQIPILKIHYSKTNNYETISPPNFLSTNSDSQFRQRNDSRRKRVREREGKNSPNYNPQWKKRFEGDMDKEAGCIELLYRFHSYITAPQRWEDDGEVGAIRVGSRIVYVELSLSLSFLFLFVRGRLRGNGGRFSRFTMMARFPLCPPRVRRHREISACLAEILWVEGRIPRAIIARKSCQDGEYR